MTNCPRKGLQSGLDCKNWKYDAIQSAIKSCFLEWISNPGAIHQKGMQSGFCNPAITILPMPVYYKLEKFNIEENKIRFVILKIAGQSGPLLVHAAPCDQKIIIFPNNIVFIAQKTRCICNDDSKPVVLAKDTLGTTLNWWSALPLLQIPRLSKHFTQYAVKRDCFFTAHLQNIKCNP